MRGANQELDREDSSILCLGGGRGTPFSHALPPPLSPHLQVQGGRAGPGPSGIWRSGPWSRLWGLGHAPSAYPIVTSPPRWPGCVLLCSTPPEQRRHQLQLKIQPLENTALKYSLKIQPSGSSSIRGLGFVVTGHAAARLTCPCRAGGQECPSGQRDASGRFAKCWAVPGLRGPLHRSRVPGRTTAQDHALGCLLEHERGGSRSTVRRGGLCLNRRNPPERGGLPRRAPASAPHRPGEGQKSGLLGLSGWAPSPAATRHPILPSATRLRPGLQHRFPRPPHPVPRGSVEGGGPRARPPTPAIPRTSALSPPRPRGAAGTRRRPWIRQRAPPKLRVDKSCPMGSLPSVT